MVRDLVPLALVPPFGLDAAAADALRSYLAERGVATAIYLYSRKTGGTRARSSEEGGGSNWTRYARMSAIRSGARAFIL